VKRFAIACAGSVALAASVALAPTTTAAVAQVSASTAPTVAIGVEGTNGEMYVQAPQLSAGWHSEGGAITGPPAVAAAPNADGASPASPLFIATGTNQHLYMRSMTEDWHEISPVASCLGSPAAMITTSGETSTLTVACEGTNRALYYDTATLPLSGLPTFTSGWKNLGGTLAAGPAVATVGATLTFFALGTTGHIYTRTIPTGFAETPWTCTGTPAAALQAATGVTIFACNGGGDALWYATSSGGGWSTPASLGGTLTGGPAIAPASGQVEFFAEGPGGAVYERTLTTGWTSLGGSVINGVGAVALNNTAGGAPWGDAIEVPGTAALNTGGVAVVASVSCPSAGNCTVGGQYADKSGISAQAFVADEVNGSWGDAAEVPGTAALNTGDYAFVSSVSCASAGNCVAGGEYSVSSSAVNGDQQAFVADEVNGVWGDAMEVPGTAALNAGNGAQVESVSCASTGNCAAVGFYADSSGGRQAFVADESGGVWGDAMEVPGTAGLNTAGDAEVASVSCASAGNCALGGSYNVESTGLQAFVADESGGVWGDAMEVPGTAALNTGGGAGVASVSCASAGNCTAGGGYSDSSDHGQVFVADESGGVWGDAMEVPGTAALNSGGVGSVSSVSCASPDNCVVGGEIAPSSSARQPFVADEVNGTWEDAIEVTGTPSSVGGDLVASVSCPSVGNCAADGYAELSNNGSQAFLVTEVNGTWGAAIQVPGLTTPAEVVTEVSCPPVGACVAGGEFDDTTSGGNQAFIVSQN
jgi:hypothetical protein